MAYLAVCCTAMCFSLNGAGIREIGPVPASLVLIVGPALVVILKMLDTGGCLSMRQLVGIGLVITGFVLVVLDVVGLGAEGRGEKEKGGR
jgi:drug/metabolite transporter (DMT)-like permease